MGGMKLKSIITRVYEKLHGLKVAKNKPNVNIGKIVLISVNPCL